MGVILIAFERESEQRTLEQLLSGRGHRVVRSANGLAALDAARREPPHAIVSDIVLPRMDGFALCRKWKQDERLQSIPFVFYTRRHDDPKYERFALELGAERFLARSVPPESLLTTLDDLLADVPTKSNATTPLPTLDESAIQRATAFERAQHAQSQSLAQLQAMESAKEAQQKLRSRIAELDATNRRLAAGEARFRRVFESNPLPIWIVDQATGGFIAVNDAALALHGYGRAELLALKAAQLEMPGTEHESAGLRAHRRKDGTAIALSVASHEIEFDGRSADLVCACDLTSRLATERQRQDRAATGRAQPLNQRQLEFLVEMSGQSDSLDEPSILVRAVEQAAEAARSPLAYLYLIDPARKTMTLAAWREAGQSHSPAPEAEARPVARAGPFTECLRARRAASSNDPGRKVQAEGLPDLHRYLAVPMVAGDETVAVLGVANRDIGYGEQDQEMLAALADGVWRILHSRRVHARNLRSLQRNEVALQGMIDTFVRVSERHDPYTAGSSRRIAALAVALGREAGLDGERQHALRIAALLHDVGNIAVPASILGKPAALTDAELALMRTHAEEGCRLLADIDFGAPIADIIYQTHERYDGSGYPRGIKGEEILPEARILAIADTVEAMCSPRPYRPAAGMAAAIEEINRGAGRLYDPHLVAACTRLVRQRGFALPQ